jgi:hypothetical protein
MLGCEVKRVALTREAASSVDSNGVAQVQSPGAFLIQHHGGSGSCFGVIGAAASLSTAGDVEKRSTEMAAAMSFDPGAEFTRMLVEAVSAAGFRTASLEVARAGPGKLLEDPGSIDAKGADAILDVAIENLGYATQRPMTSPYWRPAARTHVAIIDVRSRKRIYAETFMSGYHHIATALSLDREIHDRLASGSCHRFVRELRDIPVRGVQTDREQAPEALPLFEATDLF